MTACRQADPPNWFEVLPDDPARVLYESDYDTMILYSMDSTPSKAVWNPWTTRFPNYLYRKRGNPDTIVEIGPGQSYHEKVFDNYGRLKYILWVYCTEPQIKIFRYRLKPKLMSIEGYKYEGGPIKAYDTISIKNINDSLSQFYDYSIKKSNPNNPRLDPRICYTQKDSGGDHQLSWLVTTSEIYHSLKLHGNSGISTTKRFIRNTNLFYITKSKIEDGLITHCTEYWTNDTSEYMYKYN